MENNGILIRNFKEEDLEQVKKLINEFHNESLQYYKIIINDKTISKTVGLFLNKNNIGLVALKNDIIIGCLGGIISKSMFDEFELVGQEAMWYVTKNERFGTCGYRLMIEFEKICKEKGAKSIHMANMNNLNADKLENFYIRNGYEKIQTIYKKNFLN